MGIYLKKVWLLLLLFFGVCSKVDFRYSAYTVHFAEKEEIISLSKWATEGQFQTSSSKIRTNAILVIQDGKTILEAYSSGFGPITLHPTWSISKFLLNGAVGQAVALGKLDLEKPVRSYLPKYSVSNSEELKVKHLLFFASGIDWKERYEWAPVNSDILKILYGEENKDIADYISKLKFSHVPGEKISYSSGDSNLLSAVLNSVEKNFPEVYFKRIGIGSYIWERDGKGVPVASSYVYLSARDLAKIGLLYSGEISGKPSGIFSKDWIPKTFRIYDLKSKRPWYLDTLRIPSMGGHVYLNRFSPDSEELYYPELSTDSFFASGHWGQYMVVDPEKKLVVVRLGNDRGARFPMREFLDRLLPIINEKDQGKFP
ncbi:serine hydrolase domain-containing protein [Leptospira dzoumogneensis]|uniref:Class C beta-lactamase-related serine hydrolase n=1 Tax=Leptospira dzoumogneensis TaxID=2484904 RepID=A0A4Z1APX8_9LEPT|nr:serine hydrolase [Leptospira dzoumogneensis]TGM96164.1 class C beta-lactamase-related serine hydrolase [Leptospira dzoumogneensis]